MAPARDVEKTGGFKDTQSRIGQYSTLMRVSIVTAVSFAQFLSFFDQTSVNTAVPTIASSLHIGSSISWVATSFLCSSTAAQLIIGRLSDILGRKTTMIGALCLLIFGETMNGFAKNDVWLYACRAVAGLGAGSLGSQAQIVITDITSMEQRGKYLGITGIAVALGNGLGPVIGGVVTQHAGWRWVFWIVPPLTFVCLCIIIWIVPGAQKKENIKTRLQQIDWFGTIGTLIGTYLVLLPISQVNSTFPDTSPEFIAILVCGLVLFLVIFIYEGFFAKLPVIALYLFKQGYPVNVFVWENVAIGWVYFGNLFYTPQYLQNVLGNSPSRAGVLILPLVLTHGVASACCGQLVSRTKRYVWAITMGLALWTIGLSCQAAFYNENTGLAAIVIIGLVEGIGVGFCLQNVMVGILSHTYKRDRAVATGLRSFVRGVSGAIGLAVSNAILNSVLRSGLKGVIPDELIPDVASSTTDLAALGLDDAQQAMVRSVYMRGIHIIFITYAPMMGLGFLAMLTVKDRGMKQMDERVKEIEEKSEDKGEEQVKGNAITATEEKTAEKALEAPEALNTTEKTPAPALDKATA